MSVVWSSGVRHLVYVQIIYKTYVCRLIFSTAQISYFSLISYYVRLGFIWRESNMRCNNLNLANGVNPDLNNSNKEHL
jgi:hypothetical protein